MKTKRKQVENPEIKQLKDALFNVMEQRDAARRELAQEREQNGDGTSRKRFEQVMWQIGTIKKIISLRSDDDGVEAHKSHDAKIIDAIYALIDPPIIQVVVGMDMQFVRPTETVSKPIVAEHKDGKWETGVSLAV